MSLDSDVNNADYTERNPNLADLKTVRQGHSPDDIAENVRQSRHLDYRICNSGDASRVESNSILRAFGHVGLFAAF